MFTSLELQNFFNVAYSQQQIFLRTPFCTVLNTACPVLGFLSSLLWKLWFLSTAAFFASSNSPQSSSGEVYHKNVCAWWFHLAPRTFKDYYSIYGTEHQGVKESWSSKHRLGFSNSRQADSSTKWKLRAKFTVISNEYILLWLELQKILKIWFCINYF